MTHRELFLKRVNGQQEDGVLFMPDITVWYQFHRLGPTGGTKRYYPGEFIPDDDPMHKEAGAMPPEYREGTLTDLYRKLGCGFPVHNYRDWVELGYDGVEHREKEEGDEREETFAVGGKKIRKRWQRNPTDGSWGPCEYFFKSVEDFAVMEKVLERRKLTLRNDKAEAVLSGLGDLGPADTVILGSPFGKLVRDLMGLEKTTYALHDDPDRIEGYLRVQEEHDLAMFRLAARSPAPVVILGDNMDEFLIPPPWYARYCIPFYRKAAEIVHAAGKKLSCHMDGRLKNLLPMVKETGIDILDGCTPYPMNDFTPKELRAALGPGQYAWCGIPATFFVGNTPAKKITETARSIIDALGERLLLNIGDILPANGDIRKLLPLLDLSR